MLFPETFKMHFHGLFILYSLLLNLIIPRSLAVASHTAQPKQAFPFSPALDTLQKQIGYKFMTIDLLNRALTHPSYSLDNNRALGILGLDVVRTSISMHYLGADLDISANELNRRISSISDGKPCAAEGRRLGLHKVVKVAGKTNSSADSVLCGAYRAIFGAVALDAGKVDDAGGVFWNVHGGGAALPISEKSLNYGNYAYFC